MPLIKHSPAAAQVAPAQALAADVIAAQVATIAAQVAATEAPKAEAAKVYTGGRKAAASDTMSKADWADKDARISLQGVLQALLGSVSFGQYSTGTTADEYLTLVEGAALRLARFVKDNAGKGE